MDFSGHGVDSHVVKEETSCCPRSDTARVSSAVELAVVALITAVRVSFQSSQNWILETMPRTQASVMAEPLMGSSETGDDASRLLRTLRKGKHWIS